MPQFRALRLGQSVILLGLAGVLAGKVLGGSIGFYINPSLAGLTLAAAIGLVPIGLAAGWAAWRGPPPGHGPADAATRPGPARWLIAGVLVIPLAIGLLPPRPLDSAALTGRSVNSGGAGPASGAAGPAAAGDPRARTIFDWVRAFQQAAGPAPLASQPVDVTGFVYRDPAGPAPDADYWTVARFTVTCCAADASGVALTVRSPGAASLPADSWVHVVGTLGLETREGETRPVVFADQVTRIPPPADPYLYP
ncbi:MAG TPA: TIGR03943 family protein [Chloroflexia bacterium]|nr:TIGR03943 family protein [Chloroflexia bacterium]